MSPMILGSEERHQDTTSFRAFQDLDPRILEAAAMSHLSGVIDKTLDWLEETWPEYRDDWVLRRWVNGWLDKLCGAVASPRWHLMLLCWLACDRDMMRTKLTWTPEWTPSG